MRGEDQAGGRSDDVELADLGARRAKLRLRHADLCVRGVAGGLLGVDLRLGDEAAALEGERALVIVLGERRIGACRGDLRGELRRLLRLHRAVDDGEHLPGTDPAASIDEDADDAAALARDPDRLVTPGAKRAAGGDDPADLALARNDHGDRGHLPGRLSGGSAAGPCRRPGP